MSIDDDKRLAATAAAVEIEPGMIVGLGTGSTAAYLIAHLGQRVLGGFKITAVATSLATEAAARAAGITVLPLDDIAEIDLAIDGVDEIDGHCRAIKGAGGAMLREKIVATAARRMIAIADGSKRVAALGHAPVPVEILPLARAFVADRIAKLGATPELRLKDGQYWRTDQDNLILDCKFPQDFDPANAAAQLAAIPGLLGHGLFLTEIDSAYIAHDGAVSRVDRTR
ncbi:ribose-5-phosphate isomerase RpiA [Sphingomonas sp. GB1N7]|uniref:ribose-5-phosphate isomerase RpiA n=1 Tax=Parasphingomonas caseinilytica TaxID=3096158 RepID=UPI002FC97EB2